MFWRGRLLPGLTLGTGSQALQPEGGEGDLSSDLSGLSSVGLSLGQGHQGRL